MSKRKLWPTSTLPPTNSRSAGRTVSIRGAGSTIDSEIPVRTVIARGIAQPGFTSVWNVPRHSPPRSFTAPISVIAQEPGSPPVVSRSTTQNVTACSGVPRSSKERCPCTSGDRASGRTSLWAIGRHCGEHAFVLQEHAFDADAKRSWATLAAVAGSRYRCTACGNLTRFDVTSTRTTRAFHHYTVGGDLAIEEEQVLSEVVEEVACRWCGSGRDVEVLAPSEAHES